MVQKCGGVKVPQNIVFRVKKVLKSPTRIQALYSTYLYISGSEKADSSISLGSIQDVVCDSYECYFWIVKIFMKNLHKV